MQSFVYVVAVKHGNLLFEYDYRIATRSFQIATEYLHAIKMINHDRVFVSNCAECQSGMCVLEILHVSLGNIARKFNKAYYEELSNYFNKQEADRYKADWAEKSKVIKFHLDTYYDEGICNQKIKDEHMFFPQYGRLFSTIGKEYVEAAQDE